MPRNTFERRLDILSANVGYGDLEGEVRVDRVYAAVQHNNREYRHPRGGGPDFLGGPLRDNISRHAGHLADGLLDGKLNDHMAENMEELCEAVEREAPVDQNNLRRSAAPTVTDDGRVVYNRPPGVPRLER